MSKKSKKNGRNQIHLNTKRRKPKAHPTATYKHIGGANGLKKYIDKLNNVPTAMLNGANTLRCQSAIAGLNRVMNQKNNNSGCNDEINEFISEYLSKATDENIKMINTKLQHKTNSVNSENMDVNNNPSSINSITIMKKTNAKSTSV
jgi:hypothetical protein